MPLKNSFKLLVNFFGLLWVLILYAAIILIVIASFGVAMFSSILNKVAEMQIGSTISSAFNTILSGEEVNDAIIIIAGKVSEFFHLINTNEFFGLKNILIFITISLFTNILISLFQLPATIIVDSKMSSNYSPRFFRTYFSSFGLSVRFALCNLLFVLGYSVFSGALWFLIYRLTLLPYLGLFSPMFFCLTALILLSLRSTLSAYWIAETLESRKIFPSFASALKISLRSFNKTFTSFMILWGFLFAINIFFGFFTFGAGLIITVPVSMIMVIILKMTLYYENKSKRYYLDEERLYTPKTAKIEAEQI